MSRRKRKKKNHKYSSDGLIYDNCIIQAPDGAELARCRAKRCQWYLDRGLATTLSTEPLTVRLHFEPSGRSNIKEATTIKENKCVVCGSTKHLNVHHIVPYCFRHYMPSSWKSSPEMFHDVMVICVPCHDAYEEIAQKVKNRIAKEMGISVHGYDVDCDPKRNHYRSNASALLYHKNEMPPERIKEAMATVEEYFGRVPTKDDLLALSKLKSLIPGPNFKPFGKYVIEHTEDLGTFVIQWRRHFLESLNPKYMPDYWKLERLPQ